jgi:hypothetical protein
MARTLGMDTRWDSIGVNGSRNRRICRTVTARGLTPRGVERSFELNSISKTINDPISATTPYRANPHATH